MLINYCIIKRLDTSPRPVLRSLPIERSGGATQNDFLNVGMLSGDGKKLEFQILIYLIHC